MLGKPWGNESEYSEYDAQRYDGSDQQRSLLFLEVASTYPLAAGRETPR
jgi:hypothetical protein